MTTEPTEKHREKARELLRACEQRTGMDLASDSLPNDLADRIASALSARDAEVREVLEGLSRVLRFRNGPPQRCWCEDPNSNWTHTPACVAARALYNRLQSAKES